ncbi:MAG: GIY-YIG nuclease family protein [Patescibacteria group bacterium]
MLFMHFVYILKMNNSQVYIGFTDNLQKRLEKHNTGNVFTTSKYLPIALVYFECYCSKKDALQREKMLKKYGSTWSHLKRRISGSLED